MDKAEPSDINRANDRKREQEALERERSELLQRVSDWMETPMLILAFIWLALLV